MGMFDTIYFESPFMCPRCHGEIHHVQTHHFDEIMADYHVGSIVSSPVLSGILKEELWCDHCYKLNPTERQEATPVYIVIWHSVLAGVDLNLKSAEARLAAVDRLDLIGWLDEAQRDARRWKRRFSSLHSDVTRWHDHLNRPPEPDPTPDDTTAKPKRALASWLSLPDEILSVADPLAALLEKHTPTDEKDEPRGMFD